MTIGITGGIGSGKSYVSRWLEQHYQIPVYDCDSQAQRLMRGRVLRRKITALVGEDAYRPDGQLDRVRMAAYVFGDASHTAAINSIVHPAVKADFRRWAKRHEGLVAIESAILIEAGFHDVADKVIVVEAPLPLRIRRVVERDHTTEEQVRARIARQLSDEERCRAADLVIINDGSDFSPQLKSFIESLIIQQ